jgi:hypothetical protein
MASFVALSNAKSHPGAVAIALAPDASLTVEPVPLASSSKGPGLTDLWKNKRVLLWCTCLMPSLWETTKADRIKQVL